MEVPGRVRPTSSVSLYFTKAISEKKKIYAALKLYGAFGCTNIEWKNSIKRINPGVFSRGGDPFNANWKMVVYFPEPIELVDFCCKSKFKSTGRIGVKCKV